VQILDRTIGSGKRMGICRYSPSDYSPELVWTIITEDIEREQGTFQIGSGNTFRDRFATYFLRDGLPLNERVDAIEMAFRIAGKMPIIADFVRREYDMDLTNEEAISE
jgi:hypothetical protein